MKILVINQYYAPDVASTGQLAAEICASFVAKGEEVHVVTGQPSYAQNSSPASAYEVLDGVHVHRVHLGNSKGRENLLVRCAGYLKFLFGAYKLSKAVAKIERPDIVMTFHNPPFVGWLGAKLARSYGLRFVYVPYDIHPDVLIATKWVYLPKPLVWAWNLLNHFILRQSGSVIVLGQGMKNTLVYGKNVPVEKVRVIPLWGRPELAPQPTDRALRNEYGIGDAELLFLYSGNIGIMHPLERIIAAAHELRDLPVRFVFVGDGAKRAPLMQCAANLGLQNVSFLPFQSEERFPRLVAASDACIVALEPGLEKFALPSRAFTFLSAGRPLLTLMSPEADVAKLVIEANCGWNCTDAEELIVQIKTLVRYPDLLRRAAENARQIYERRFTRESIINEYHNVIAA